MVGNMNRGDVLRAPAPYIEFKGKPLSSDHNEFGYRFDLNEKSDATIKIAFFGGSTGYLGNPPLPTILENDLEKLTHKNYLWRQCKQGSFYQNIIILADQRSCAQI